MGAGDFLNFIRYIVTTAGDLNDSPILYKLVLLCSNVLHANEINHFLKNQNDPTSSKDSFEQAFGCSISELESGMSENEPEPCSEFYCMGCY